MTDDADTQPEAKRFKLSYVLIFILIFAVLVIAVVWAGIRSNLDNRPNPVQKSNNLVSPGATKATGAPTHGTKTPSDRTVPDPSGGNGNTLLKPK